MKNALVVVNDDDAHRSMLREAGELAGGVGASLVLVSFVSASAFERDSERLDRIGDVEGAPFDGRAILDAARDDARHLGESVLDGVDVDCEYAGALADDDRHSRIVDLAEQFDCDYVFLVGRRRSPTGKAVFGDTAQQVILTFDGRVVVSTD